MKAIKINNVESLIIELRKLDFLDKVEYFKDSQEGIAIKYRNHGNWKIIRRFLGRFGKRLSETFIIQILQNEKTKESYVWVDELNNLDNHFQAIELLDVIIKTTGGKLTQVSPSEKSNNYG